MRERGEREELGFFWHFIWAFFFLGKGRVGVLVCGLACQLGMVLAEEMVSGRRHKYQKLNAQNQMRFQLPAFLDLLMPSLHVIWK